MTEKQASNSLPKLLASIEDATGLSLCLKELTPSAAAQAISVQLPHTNRNHLTPFCLSVKTTRNDRCRQCDLRDVPARASSIELPFVSRCHASASEIIIPICVSNNLLMLGYLGQFRETESQPRSLPLLSPDTVAHLLQQALLLQRYLLYEIEHFGTAASGDTLREHLIRQFLQTRIKQNPSLGELAKTLGLSTSRAGHLVKELTGHTFVDLKLHYRIEAACKMLTSTLLTIEHISEETGFADPRYFYRVFNEMIGTSPARWRAKMRQHARLQA